MDHPSPVGDGLRSQTLSAKPAGDWPLGISRWATQPEVAMYEAFDELLKSDTWNARQGAHREDFYRTLDKVVRRPDFSPRALADHIRFVLEDNSLDHIVDQLQTAATHVREYLVACGQIEPSAM